MVWVSIDGQQVADGPRRLKWADESITLEHVRNIEGKPCIVASHRGVEFVAQLYGNGFLMDDGQPEVPAGVQFPPPEPEDPNRVRILKENAEYAGTEPIGTDRVPTEPATPEG